jgi:hypothetical protein
MQRNATSSAALPLQSFNDDFASRTAGPLPRSRFSYELENRPPWPLTDIGIYGWWYPGCDGMVRRVKLAEAMRNHPRLAIRARVEESYPRTHGSATVQSPTAGTHDSAG